MHIRISLCITVLMHCTLHAADPIRNDRKDVTSCSLESNKSFTSTITNTTNLPIRVQMINSGNQLLFVKKNPTDWGSLKEEWQYFTQWHTIHPEESIDFEIPDSTIFKKRSEDFSSASVTIRYIYASTVLRIRACNKKMREKFDNKRIKASRTASSVKTQKYVVKLQDTNFKVRSKK